MQKLLAGELPDPVWIGVSPAGNGATLGRGERARAMALIALHYYSRAIVTLQRHQAYTNDLLDELETQVVGISYVMFHAYNTGRASLMRQVSYAAARGDPLVARTVALIQVADWDLVFTKHGTALDTYEQAYALLKQNGVPAEAIDSLFAPRVPIMLPTFLPNPLATDALEATGYIDVAFDVHKYGSANHVEILDSTPNATGADKEALVSLIRLGNFRPRVTEGEFARSSSVTLRYFLHAPSAVAND
jgi:hypothetical protein